MHCHMRALLALAAPYSRACDLTPQKILPTRSHQKKSPAGRNSRQVRDEPLRTPRLLARSLHQAGARITAVRAYSSQTVSSQFDADAGLLLADQPRETGDIARWWATENIPSLPSRLVSRNLPAILLGVGDEPLHALKLLSVLYRPQPGDRRL